MKIRIIILFSSFLIFSCSCSFNMPEIKWPTLDSGEGDIEMTKYTVTFNTNGGTEIYEQQVNQNELLKEPVTPIKSYNVFQGWYSDEDFAAIWHFNEDIITSDTILYAKWTEETFDIADIPSFDLDSEDNFKLRLPWNYFKEYNQNRKYPIIISLHGSTSLKTEYMVPSVYLNETSMQAYPSFFMAPNANTPTETRSWEQATDWLLARIESLKSEYRIDTTRIYLIGYSMGGSGSYIVANKYYNDYDQLFAGIIRVAGKSQTTVEDEIAEKTSIWYNVGLLDSSQIQEVASDAYEFIEKHSVNSDAEKRIDEDTFSSHPRETYTIIRNGTEVFKKSEYTGLDHDPLPLNDTLTVEWLYKQYLR